MYKLENNILPFHNNKPYTLRQTCYRQTLSAVTGACMMMRNKVFEEVGGFEERLSHAFNDADLS